MAERKPFLLRIDRDVLDAVQRWADDDLRSLNAQSDFLLRRACTTGQGYYYSPPLPADEFDAFVRSYRPRPADRFAA